MMMSCRQVCDSASEIADGDLGTWQRLQVRVHLLICKYCRRYIRQFSIMVGAIQDRDQPEEAPSDADIDAIMARLNEQRASGHPDS